MAYTDIDRPSDYFRTKLYTGTGSQQIITFDESTNMKPDFLWFKGRNSPQPHGLYDVIRGVNKSLRSNDNSAEETSTSMSAFNSNGFTVENNGKTGENAVTYVNWSWLADNTSGSSNTDGSITSSVSANTTSGFSIVSYTGNGTGGATVGHGLGVAPNVVIIKRRNTIGEWVFGHSSLGFTKFIEMNSTGAAQTNSTRFNDTAPTSNVFTIGTAVDTNTNGGTYIAYCFSEKKGYSKFGSYTGNGNADGTFIYTGFRPAFVMSKRSDSADGWRMMDTARSPYNVAQHRLLANATDTEVVASSQDKDFLSNGFKIRTSDSGYNFSGGTYIYMAFAENPFTTSTGIPTTAR